MAIFQNILLVYNFIPETKHSYDVAMEIAKHFDSNITLLMCMHDEPPKFTFFSTKKEKKEKEILIEKTKEFLDSLEKDAKADEILLKTEFMITEKVMESTVSYVVKQHVDLLIIDSPQLDKIEHDNHKETVNKIYKSVTCPILTLK